MVTVSEASTTPPQPSSLFKYLAPDRLEALDGWLRCSPPVVLNDVFEMTANFAAWSTPAELQTIIAEAWPAKLDGAVADAFVALERHTEVSREQLLALPGAKEKLQEFLRQWTDVTPHVSGLLDALLPRLNEVASATMGAAIGVISFTEDRASLLMWAHYAEKHMGFVIEFAPEHPWFDRRRGTEDEFFSLRRVHYQRQRAALVATETTGEEVFLTKGQEWAYEREWRVLIPLEECEVKGQDTRHGVPISAVRIPREAMRRVILGCRMTAEARLAVVERAAGLPVHEAVPCRGTYGLETRPIPLSVPSR
jgi:DUF2971 family protein